MIKPKLLLDENIGKKVASRLRDAGWDVVSILEEAPGIEDPKVLKRAVKEKRIVVTLDQDFGTLIFRDSNKHVGVLLLRLEKESAENLFQTINRVLKQYGKALEKKFTVASESQVRIR